MCVLIPGKDPLPPLDEVFSYLAQEEDHHNLMTQPQQEVIDRLTLVSSSQNGGRGFFCGRGGGGRSLLDDRDKLKCEHCGRTIYTKETYWDLHGCLQ